MPLKEELQLILKLENLNKELQKAKINTSPYGNDSVKKLREEIRKVNLELAEIKK